MLKSYLPPAPAPAPLLPPPEQLGNAGAADSTGSTSAADQELDGEGGDEDDEGQVGGGEMSINEGESLEDFKARLKKSAAPKKSSISAEMLDTANSYDDKVALVRMLVTEDSGRVAAVLKNMIKQDMVG